MDNDENILGYIVCHDCMTPKQIIQGQGKRARFVRAKCECGSSNLTGAAIQKKWRNYKTLDEIKAEIQKISEPTPKPEFETDSQDLQQTSQSMAKTEPAGFGKWLIGGTLAIVGLGTAKLLRA